MTLTAIAVPATVAAPAYSHVHTGLASATFRPEDAVWVVGQWCVFVDDSLMRFEVYVDGVNKRCFLHTDTWESLGGEAEVQFQEDFIEAYAGREVTEMRFMMTDSGHYGDAARAQAQTEGTSAIRAKDRITDLTERLQSLVVQAASLNQAPTEVQLQAFAVRHARIGQEMAALETDMLRLRGLLGLAGTAIVDASS